MLLLSVFYGVLDHIEVTKVTTLVKQNYSQTGNRINIVF